MLLYSWMTIFVSFGFAFSSFLSLFTNPRQVTFLDLIMIFVKGQAQS